MMGERTKNFIESTLVNDEVGTDEEIRDVFMHSLKCTKDEAMFYVSQRKEALRYPLTFKLKLTGANI